MKKFLTFFAILIFSVIAFGQKDFETYSNARFGYSISYPSNLLKPQGEADNGDGQKFSGDGAAMLVYGSNMLPHKTLPGEYAALIKERGAKNVSYKLLRGNYFVISGKSDDKVFYQKTFKNAQGQFITFSIEYDESKRKTYNAVVLPIVNSFK